MPTRPGINEHFPMEKFLGDEQRIIRGMANLFYITRSIGSIPIGNATYRAFFMRPADDTSLILNVEREFVVLIAPYETFEARTLKAYDEIYEQFDAVRIDRSIRFLVSKDCSIEDSIRHFLSRNLEYPIIVPFTYSGPWSATDIFAHIRRNYTIRDLFGFQAPLKSEHFFFGRDRLVADVIDLHKTGQNSGLFGLRKSGKTSTIYAIQRRARSSSVRSVVIDCQDPAIHAHRFAPLLFYIISEIRRSCGLKPIDLPVLDEPAGVSARFRDTITMTLGQVGSDILLIFDEIENISPSTAASPHWRSGRESVLFWQTLRSFFQSARKYKLTFCFVGTNPNLLETPKLDGIDNPVYLFAKKIYIPNLAEADTRKMVTHLGFFMGLDFPDEVISYIHGLYGGHPFFTRQLCSEIHVLAPLTRPIKISKRLCDEAASKSQASTRRYIEEIVNSLANFYPEEYELLELLASDDIDGFVEYVEEAPDLLEHLLGYQIIVKRGGDYEFTADNIRSVLKKKRGVEATEDRWHEIGSRRNRVEQEIRVALFHWARNIDDMQWDSACMACIPKHVKENGIPTRSEAFSRAASPLLLLDLMRFIEQSGIASGAHLSESAVKGAIHCVNKNRVDAHAKEISKKDFDACK